MTPGRFSDLQVLGGLLAAGGQAGFRPLNPLFFGGATAPDVRLHRRYNWPAVIRLQS